MRARVILPVVTLMICCLTAGGFAAEQPKDKPAEKAAAAKKYPAATATPGESADSRAAADKIWKEAKDKAFPIGQDIFTKKKELEAAMAQPAPDMAKVKALNKDIHDLKAKMADIRLEARAQVAKATGVRGGKTGMQAFGDCPGCEREDGGGQGGRGGMGGGMGGMGGMMGGGHGGGGHGGGGGMMGGGGCPMMSGGHGGGHGGGGGGHGSHGAPAAPESSPESSKTAKPADAAPAAPAEQHGGHAGHGS